MATVLHIEDNPANRRLVELILRMRPHLALLEAATGREGLDLAQQHRPDLILLDKQLPDMRGDEVLAALKSDGRTREIPVVVISAEASADAMRRLRAAGAREYLMKPIEVSGILALLDEILPA
jgi:CheY-like chemotaxis protein